MNQILDKILIFDGDITPTSNTISVRIPTEDINNDYALIVNRVIILDDNGQLPLDLTVHCPHLVIGHTTINAMVCMANRDYTGERLMKIARGTMQLDFHILQMAANNITKNYTVIFDTTLRWLGSRH